MPNWCLTTYKCVGSAASLKELHRALKYMEGRKTSILKNGFGKMWLGNLIFKLGGDWEKYRCRGEVLNYSFENNVLTIVQETAWCEQEGVRIFIETKFPDVKVYFMDEESAMGYYVTNDKSFTYFSERFFLDANEGGEYFKNINEAAAYVSNIVGYKIDPNVNTINKALDDFIEEQHDEDMFFNLHEFVIVD